METDNSDHKGMHNLLEQNKKLLEENNKLLRKINRYTVMTFWVRILWISVIIGLPFVLYFFVIEPYFEALGSSYEVFRAGLEEIPGWKQFYQSIRAEDINGGE